MNDVQVASDLADSTPTRVVLVRHAESVANTQLHFISGRSNHSPLTTVGEQQASALGEALKAVGYSPDVVYSSPAVRTAETARLALLALNHANTINIDDRLQELEQGEWTGRLRDETYTPEMSAHIATLGVEFAAPGGESMRDVGERMLDWIRAAGCTESRDVLAFTHGVAIRCLAGLVEEWPHEQIWQAHLENTSVTVFEVTDQVVSLQAFDIQPADLITRHPIDGPRIS